MFNSLKRKSKTDKEDSFKKPSKIAGFPVKLEDHSNTVFCCAFSPVESAGNAIDLATASYDGTTRVWDIAKCTSSSSKKTKKVLKGSTSGVWCCAYSQDASVLVAGCSKGSICVYNAAKGKYDLIGRQDSSHGASAVFACSVGRDLLLATGGGDNKIKLWGLNSSPFMKAELVGHSGDVVACTFRPGSDVVVSGSEDRHVRLWDINSQDCLQTLIGHTAEVCSATYNQEGSMLATGSSDKTVRLWDARQKNRCIQTLAGHTASVYSCAFRKGGQYELLASASQDGSVVLWDPRTWKCCQVLRHHHGEVVGLAWHPSGQYMATGSADMTVNLHAIRDSAPEDSDFAEVQSEKFMAESGIFVPVESSGTSHASGPLNPPARATSGSRDVTLGGPGSGGGPASGGTPVVTTPKVMEVSADTHLSPSGASSTTAHHGRAHLGTDAATREGGHVEDATRRELEGELARQRELLDKAMVERRRREGALMEGRKADPVEVEELRQSLVAFYTKVNPSKLANVDTIVHDYAARGGGAEEREALNEDLRTVYQCDLSSVTPPGGFGAAQRGASAAAAAAGFGAGGAPAGGEASTRMMGTAIPAAAAAAAAAPLDFSGLCLGDTSFHDAEPPSFHGPGPGEEEEEVVFDDLDDPTDIPGLQDS